ncbi:hypothetical protein LOAG_02876 [Loa loa]|uniref:Uncharacterized protein n=1 Tax=Loa loa TaxID=7209 RepID=A0A1S0U7H8_LOALO|nr:hypothetical protein LOAG_02876 [Loa loa]EFO25606.1 hypothetical protein LOAG_02876 [Loa loa]
MRDQGCDDDCTVGPVGKTSSHDEQEMVEGRKGRTNGKNGKRRERDEKSTGNKVWCDERVVDDYLLSPTNRPSIHPSIHLSIHLSVQLSIRPFIQFIHSLSHSFIHPFIHSFIHPFILLPSGGDHRWRDPSNFRAICYKSNRELWDLDP